MKNKSAVPLSSLLLLGIVLITSCDLNSNTLDAVNFQNEFMGTYLMYKSAVPSSFNESRTSSEVSYAVAPVWDSPGTFTNGGTHSVSNYPEKGLDTEWTYASTAVTGPKDFAVWKVTAVTTYPGEPLILNTTEIYYVEDSDNNGSHTEADEYTDQYGFADSDYRERFRTYFADGTQRKEYIIGQADNASYRYAVFDINGNLDYDTLSIPTESFDPYSTDPNRWSSLVYYSHNMKDGIDYGWWSDLKRASVSGERYYSHDTSSGVNKQTYIFKEFGLARNIVWDDSVAPTLEDSSFAIFKGVLRMEIDNSTGNATIKGQYVVSGWTSTTTILIDNDIITVY